MDLPIVKLDIHSSNGKVRDESFPDGEGERDGDVDYACIRSLLSLRTEFEFRVAVDVDMDVDVDVDVFVWSG